MADPRTDERGFTLTEVLVATLLMMMVLFSLYALFDMSVRVFGIGNSEVETNEQARVAMERMEREIRSACNAESGCADNPDVLLRTAEVSEIEFWNILDNGSQTRISYYVCDGVLHTCGSQNAGRLMRRQDGGDPGEFLATIGSTPSESPLNFVYRDAGYAPASPSDDVAMVEITLEVEDGGRTQTLNTVAGLRNYEEDS